MTEDQNAVHDKDTLIFIQAWAWKTGIGLTTVRNEKMNYEVWIHTAEVSNHTRAVADCSSCSTLHWQESSLSPAQPPQCSFVTIHVHQHQGDGSSLNFRWASMI